jgi:hypothetical protein
LGNIFQIFELKAAKSLASRNDFKNRVTGAPVGSFQKMGGDSRNGNG